MKLISKLPHDIKSKHSYIVDFAFKGGDKTFISLSNIGTGDGGRKTKRRLGFSKTALKTAINHLIGNYYFNVGNVTMKQAFVIPIN